MTDPHDEAETESVMDRLRAAARVAPRDSDRVCPREAGLYAIWIKDGASLPEPTVAAALTDRLDGLLYVGKASRSLLKRAIQQDLRHRQASTFFRTLGAVLGFRPEPGSLRGKKNQDNYRFSRHDTASIIGWIDGNLEASWATVPCESLDQAERSAIRSATPPLNTSHNPAGLPILRILRAECRAIAQERDCDD